MPNGSNIDWKGGTLPDVMQERVIGVEDFQEPWFLRRGAEAAKAVAVIPTQGTAFLIAPNVILTNWHVFRRPEWAENKSAYFDYEQGEDGLPRQYTAYKLRPDTFFHANEVLDFAAVYVDGAPSAGRFVIDCSSPGTYADDGRANIIQHPGANLKKIAIRNNGLKYKGKEIIQYWTDTEHGSSGSPVFDDRWNIIGLHYRHDYIQDVDGKSVYYNEAHRIEPIWDELKSIIPT